MNLAEKHFSYTQVKVNLNRIFIKGSDARSFLAAQSTFDVLQLKENQFQLISFLDPQGRIQSYGWLLFQQENYHYFVPHTLVKSSLERLHRFLISEDVELEDLGAMDLYFTFNDPQNPAVKGILFDQESGLSFSDPGAPVLTDDEVESLRILTGNPLFNPSHFKAEIINNTHLFDLALSRQKGCYPGQETVNKIANNRGAAYFPLLLETTTALELGEIYAFAKKIGEINATTQYADKFYAEVKLLRDFRVEGLVLNFTLKEKEYQGKVRYLPFLKGDSSSKSEELYYRATREFSSGNYAKAEASFKRAIELNPTHGDAYEALGVMLGREDRFDEAISWMEKLAVLDETSVLAHTNLSMFYMKKGEIEKAEDHKARATMKSFASFGREAQDKERALLEKEKQISEWAKREEMFRQVLEIDSEDTLANFGLGNIAVERADFEKAVVHLEAVLKADAKYSVAYLILGQAYLGVQRKDEAIKTWKEGIVVAAAQGDLMPANQMQALLNQNS